MPAPSDTALNIATTLNALAEAGNRQPHQELAFIADGPRDLPSIEARSRAMQISHGPRPLSMGPLRPVSVAPPPDEPTTDDTDNAA